MPHLSRMSHVRRMPQVVRPAAYAIHVCIMYVVCMYSHTYSKSKDRPGKVANPARGQLNKENEYFLVPVRA